MDIFMLFLTLLLIIILFLLFLSWTVSMLAFQEKEPTGRAGSITVAAYCIAAIINAFNTGSLGGAMMGFLFYGIAAIPVFFFWRHQFRKDDLISPEE